MVLHALNYGKLATLIVDHGVWRSKVKLTLCIQCWKVLLRMEHHLAFMLVHAHPSWTSWLDKLLSRSNSVFWLTWW